MACRARAVAAAAQGWLIEERPTLGGGKVRITLCFSCRGLTGLVPGTFPCDGSCAGSPDGGDGYDDGYRAECHSCWSDWWCRDERCVQGWAEEHECEPDIEIIGPKARTA